MKLVQRSLMAATLGLLGSISTAADATTVLNIPFSAGTTALSYGFEPCSMTETGYFGTSNYCTVDVPIQLPVGHTIQQIAVVYDTSNYISGQAYISATVVAQSFVPFSASAPFFWESIDLVPPGTVKKLMGEIVIKGALISYPDQFQTPPQGSYHVRVSLLNGATFEGLQITYL